MPGHGVHFFRGTQHVHVAEAFPLEVGQGAAQLAPVLGNHVAAEVAVGAGCVAVLAQPFGHVEHNGHGQAVEFAGQLHERLAAFGLHVGGVHDGEQTRVEPLADDEVQQLKGVGAGGLVVFVVRHHAAAGVRRHDFGGLEVPAGKRRFTRTGRPDQHHQRQFGNLQGHKRRLKRVVSG
jgi:hypothetical protein